MNNIVTDSSKLLVFFIRG